MSLRLKTILGVAVIEALLLLLLVTMTLDFLRTSNYESLIKRATTTSTLFATTTKDAVLSYDLASLDSFVDEVMKNPDLRYARVIGTGDVVFASAGDPEVLARVFKSDTSVEAVSDGIFDSYAEIAEGGQVYGRVELGLDIQRLENTIQEAEKNSIIIASMEMGLVALFSFVLGTYLTRQLSSLRQGAVQIAGGNLAVNIPLSGKDEVSEVAKAFNHMAQKLKVASARRDEYEQQLTELNQTLEDRVERRTSELQKKNEELERANEEIKVAQRKLLQSEKMASVGTLAAGVAHEINNPIGFIMSNLATLEEYIESYQVLLAAHREALHLDEPDKRQAAIAEVLELEQTHDYEFMIEDVPSLMLDTKEGSTRVREIVQALKSFSHTDQSNLFALTNLNDCIETTLKVASNSFKHHCRLELELQEIPLTFCLVGPIKQVLMNMIINAGQAIEGEGEIYIKSEHVGDNVEISIRDTGKGISEAHQKQLFQPFFTTKGVGDGTGLGLSISYGIIVDDHQGDIRVESEEGVGSCFTLVIPVVTEQPHAISN